MTMNRQPANASTSLYEPSYGYMTKKFRAKYLEWCGWPSSITYMLRTGATLDGDNNTQDDLILSLQASTNTNDPLYFWQLYSLIGEELVLELLTNFYDRVFDDTEEFHWFRAIFEELTSKQYHIIAQTYMWLDCFGCGRMYHGGEFRLDFHHRQTSAFTIMNGRGAERWIHHMKAALDDEIPIGNEVTDSRIRVAINTFLQFFLEYYGDSFGFEVAPNVFGDVSKASPDKSAWKAGDGQQY
mmetsp:Transcript_19692/g.46024  ORF Transcript_19692/g.46024 Transcript_19692/m.46024 type:complete len:241 (-) Transcript_19692:286-1008(-)